jgi:hypothetical protein
MPGTYRLFLSSVCLFGCIYIYMPCMYSFHIISIKNKHTLNATSQHSHRRNWAMCLIGEYVCLCLCQKCLLPVSLATFGHFPSTHCCWSPVIATVIQVGNQAVVIWSEIRAVRRVVKQLPVEMLQQYSSVSSFMQTRVVMKKHYTVCQSSTPFVLNGPIPFFNCFAVHFWYYCGPLLHEFHQ